MPDYADIGIGLLHGLNKGIGSYYDQKKQNEMLNAEMKAKGLIRQGDEWAQDPAELARKKAEEKRKAMLELAPKGLEPVYDADDNIVDIKPSKHFGLINQSKSSSKAKVEPLTAQGKIEKLPAEARARFDNLIMAKNSIGDVKKHFKPTKGKGFLDSMGARAERVGMSKYSDAVQMVTEAIGRMQSGGAIGKEEARAYIKMLPTAFDSDERAEIKLSTLESELGNRLRGYGLDQGDLSSAGYLRQPVAEEKAGEDGLLQPGAQAQGSFPMKLRRGNETATVNSPEELQEATAEGFQ